MLTRQKVVLNLLAQAGGRMGRADVARLCFLLGRETESHGSSFYEFVPSRAGPVSFCLRHEIAKLVAQRFIELTSRKAYSLTGTGRAAGMALPENLLAGIRRVLSEYFANGESRDIPSIERRYPAWFRTALEKQEAGRQALLAVYTAGYEGLQIDGFLSLLARHGIRQLIDVRSNPVSRRYGFHKATLARLCRRVRISYCHFPELGIDSAERRNAVANGGYEAMFARYERLLPEKKATLARVGALLREDTGALVCAEAESSRCHRSRLAEAISSIAGLPVQHLPCAA